MKPLFNTNQIAFLKDFFKFELQMAVGIDEIRANVTRGLIRLLASRLKQNNPKFDKDGFLREIGHGA